MTKRIALAALVAVAGGLAACAPQAPSAPGGSVAGGGLGAALVGGGDAQVAYGRPGAGGGGGDAPPRAGGPSRFAGSHGDGPVFERAAPAAAEAGREAVGERRRRRRPGGLRPGR
jgi:hypothetical protein